MVILNWCASKFLHIEFCAVASLEDLGFCTRVILGGRTGSRLKSEAEVDYRNWENQLH